MLGCPKESSSCPLNALLSRKLCERSGSMLLTLPFQLRLRDSLRMRHKSQKCPSIRSQGLDPFSLLPDTPNDSLLVTASTQLLGPTCVSSPFFTYYPQWSHLSCGDIDDRLCSHLEKQEAHCDVVVVWISTVISGSLTKLFHDGTCWDQVSILEKHPVPDYVLDVLYIFSGGERWAAVLKQNKNERIAPITSFLSLLLPWWPANRLLTCWTRYPGVHQQSGVCRYSRV